MNDDYLYTQWINHRRKTSVPEGFARQVVESIERQASAPKTARAKASSDIAHRLMHWAAAISMVLLGIFRLFYVTANLLFGSPL
ncbi:MAG: hypothetical protein PVI89_17290 [Desulfobacteraceae bacterium]|jgi:hypothetical protein